MKDGSRLGEVSDIEIDENNGNLISLIITGKLRLFGLLGKGEPVIIPWKSVKVIGEETILVDIQNESNNAPKRNNIIKNFLD